MIERYHYTTQSTSPVFNVVSKFTTKRIYSIRRIGNKRPEIFESYRNYINWAMNIYFTAYHDRFDELEGKQRSTKTFIPITSNYSLFLAIADMEQYEDNDWCQQKMDDSYIKISSSVAYYENYDKIAESLTK